MAELLTYRGVQAVCLEHAETGRSRRVVVQTPIGGEPVIEDLGPEARTWSVRCVVAGGDYQQAAVDLEAALDDASPATLDHPGIGRVSVRCRAWVAVRRPGAVEYRLDLVEAPGPGDPAPAAATVDATGWLAALGDRLPGGGAMTDAAGYVAAARDHVRRAREIAAGLAGPPEALSTLAGQVDLLAAAAESYVSAPLAWAGAWRDVCATLARLDTPAYLGWLRAVPPRRDAPEQWDYARAASLGAALAALPEWASGGPDGASLLESLDYLEAAIRGALLPLAAEAPGAWDAGVRVLDAWLPRATAIRASVRRVSVEVEPGLLLWALSDAGRTPTVTEPDLGALGVGDEPLAWGGVAWLT